LISGWPTLAVSAAMRRWHAIASSAAAQRETVHARDDRLGHAFDLAHQGLAQQREITSLNGAEGVHFRDVGTGHEGLRARPGQHHHAHLRIGGGVLKASASACGSRRSGH
jgi:hypothetical protein